MDNKILSESFMLSNGVKIPKLGLGTWMIDDDKAVEAVRCAVEIGYRHFDTAQGYGNERGVGEGIRTCGLKRFSSRPNSMPPSKTTTERKPPSKARSNGWGSTTST